MTERHPASFRDPAGFIFRREGTLYRQVNSRYRENYDTLISSGLYQELVNSGLLVPHNEVDEPPMDAQIAYRVIEPQPISFISYPFEWSPGQLLAAAEATLEVQLVAMKYGMTLRDASAYNIQFSRGRPVLIDTLSFEPLVDGKAWQAYGQFCRHFLAPLALMKHVDVHLGVLLRTELDGVPLDLAARMLPWRTRFNFGLAVHLHAHSAAQRRAARAGKGGRPKEPRAERRVSRSALNGLVENLRQTTRRQKWEPTPSVWRDYYPKRESYSDTSIGHKAELLSTMLTEVPATMIWDLGANTGKFSRLAANATGAEVISIEMDAAAVDLNWRECQGEQSTGVHPLLMDLANPTPSQGWAHQERTSLAERGSPDLILALALIHHLAIGNNVPLPSILEWMASLAPVVLIEWIPKDDPMVRRLLSTRDDIFFDYSTDQFESAALTHFRISRKETIKDSSRALYLLERAGDALRDRGEAPSRDAAGSSDH